MHVVGTYVRRGAIVIVTTRPECRLVGRVWKISSRALGAVLQDSQTSHSSCNAQSQHPRGQTTPSLATDAVASFSPGDIGTESNQYRKGRDRNPRHTSQIDDAEGYETRRRCTKSLAASSFESVR